MLGQDFRLKGVPGQRALALVWIFFCPLLFFLAPAWAQAVKAQEGQPQAKPELTSAALEEPSGQVSPPRTIVMLGDSLTAGGQWQALDQEATIINEGITGDGYAQILARLDQTISAKPDLVFLQVGINDLGHVREISQIIDGHRAIWEKLKSALPNVRIIVCSLTPINERMHKRSKPGVNQLIRNINKLLAAKAAEEELDFIDLYTPLTGPDQGLLKSLTFDGLHLTKAGHQIWLNQLLTYLSRYRDGPGELSQTASSDKES
ncbi:MAG: GDSL-type esterase/lipase family protein [Deltaproteobacteria bacterium]|jgi:lysophospholipase L1-like esterase|nr:GDSL-type esterase/lipase family protein [Deltaproteobacteria bacterium]